MARPRGRNFRLVLEENNFAEFERQGLDAASEAALKGCEKGVITARRAAPRRTGALRGSITAAKTSSGATITSDVPYAVYQEFGVAGKIERNRFMKKGIESAQRSWIYHVGKGLRG